MRAKSDLSKPVKPSALAIASLLFTLLLMAACDASEAEPPPATAPTGPLVTATAPHDATDIASPTLDMDSIRATANRATAVTLTAVNTPDHTATAISVEATQTRAAQMMTPLPETLTPAPAAGNSNGTTTITYTPVPQLPTDTPSPTATPVVAQVYSFEVTPTQADPGDVVTLSWSAQGDSATICPTTRYVFFTNDDCWPVPLSGNTSFTIPFEAVGLYDVSFILTVESIASSTQVVGETSVALNCELTWFFSDEPQAGICPIEPIRTSAAAQRFERGTMIWLEQSGRTFILQEALMFPGEERKIVDTIRDPLDIIDDTSAEIDPPAGFYAPKSGFGLIWRGDVANSPGYRQALGWALAPEFGYDAIYQCDDAPPSGGRSWQTCYLLRPDGEIIFFHPLGGWTLLQEQ